jgi:hypothetical protein
MVVMRSDEHFDDELPLVQPRPPQRWQHVGALVAFGCAFPGLAIWIGREAVVVPALLVGGAVLVAVLLLYGLGRLQRPTQAEPEPPAEDWGGRAAR